MQAHADALPRPLDLAGKERSRRPLVRSSRGDGEFDRRESGETLLSPTILRGSSSWRAPGSHSTSSPSCSFYSPRLLQSRHEPFCRCHHQRSTSRDGGDVAADSGTGFASQMPADPCS